jgi:thiamine phosphate synthase YjbQ (UPF0047 family)
VIKKIIKGRGIREGLCLVNAMHITASVYINDHYSPPTIAISSS